MDFNKNKSLVFFDKNLLSCYRAIIYTSLVDQVNSLPTRRHMLQLHLQGSMRRPVMQSHHRAAITLSAAGPLPCWRAEERRRGNRIDWRGQVHVRGWHSNAANQCLVHTWSQRCRLMESDILYKKDWVGVWIILFQPTFEAFVRSHRRRWNEI